jgi:hypothetical protein
MSIGAPPVVSSFLFLSATGSLYLMVSSPLSGGLVVCHGCLTHGPDFLQKR